MVSKAEEMASKQRDISVAEFFEKNRHLLGFDNKRKALLTTIKEAVDNALDACEEAEILPEIIVEIIEMGAERYRVIVEDNGPGIVKAQIANIFAKLLYGSKFHKLAQSRGQQGIGISASVLYGQLTTGRPARITSKTGPHDEAHYYELYIDTKTNQPDIYKNEIVEWEKESGTRIEIDLEGSYIRGSQSVDEYLKETAIINPHCTIIYTNPKAEQFIFARASDVLPRQPISIKPHPHGIELGVLLKMMQSTEETTIRSFLMNDFSKVGNTTAAEILEKAAVPPRTKVSAVSRDEADRIMQAIKTTKIMAPSVDAISPITEQLIERGLKKEINAEFFCSVSRQPAIYRGNPFVIEVGIAYGGSIPADRSADVLRFANRVPLLYQQGACIFTSSISKTNWRTYGLNQSSGSLPQGPLVILVHIASVWVPFTSEAKEAVAHYEEIEKEVKLALQEAGRKLGSYVRKKKRVGEELKKRSYIEAFIPHISQALIEILDEDPQMEDVLSSSLHETLERSRGEIKQVGLTREQNTEYDETLARYGRGSDDDEEEEEV
ncbi:MAG: DNA topoisomerase VI subunit B [Candidatus Woesearchaeota archaeon]